MYVRTVTSLELTWKQSENYNLLADCHSILNMFNSYFYELLNVHMRFTILGKLKFI
jgi:hypothetical protein